MTGWEFPDLVNLQPVRLLLIGGKGAVSPVGVGPGIPPIAPKITNKKNAPAASQINLFLDAEEADNLALWSDNRFRKLPPWCMAPSPVFPNKLYAPLRPGPAIPLPILPAFVLINLPTDEPKSFAALGILKLGKLSLGG